MRAGDFEHAGLLATHHHDAAFGRFRGDRDERSCCAEATPDDNGIGAEIVAKDVTAIGAELPAERDLDVSQRSPYPKKAVQRIDDAIERGRAQLFAVQRRRCQNERLFDVERAHVRDLVEENHGPLVAEVDYFDIVNALACERAPEAEGAPCAGERIAAREHLSFE